MEQNLERGKKVEEKATVLKKTEREELIEIKDLVKSLEEDLDNNEIEQIFKDKAFNLAIKNEGFKEKISLLYEVLLNKLGVIPRVSLDKYRKDYILKKKLEMIQNKICILEQMTNEIMDYDYKNQKCETEKSVQQKEKKHQKQEKCNINGYIAFLVETLDKGGLEQVVALLATEFSKRAIDVKVLCLQQGGSIAQRLKESGIEIKEFNNQMRLFEKYIKKNPPILINTHFVKREIKFISNQGIPIIDVIHNMYVFFSKRAIRKEQQNAKYYSKMIAVSEIVRDTYYTHIMKNDKIEVIGNAAVVRGDLLKSRESIRGELKIGKEDIVLLNIGSIDSRKNQIGIIEAFNIASQVTSRKLKLFMAGNVQDQEYFNKVQENIEKSPVKSNIKLLPYYENVRELYFMADVFILDSYYEGWSIAATEALYEGLPVIHSECGSAKELVCNGRYGIMIKNPIGDIEKLDTEHVTERIMQCENRNIDEAVSAIVVMADNIDRWRNERETISQETIEKFSIQNMCENYLKLFEKCIEYNKGIDVKK